MVALFDRLLDDAAEAGAIRPGLRTGFLTGTMLEAIMFNAFSTTIAGVSVRKARTPPKSCGTSSSTASAPPERLSPPRSDPSGP